MKAYSRLVTQFNGRGVAEVMAEIMAINDDGIVAGAWTWTPQEFLDNVTADNAEEIVRDFLAAESDGCDVGDLELVVVGVNLLRTVLTMHVITATH
jgi:hypothetical protein